MADRPVGYLVINVLESAGHDNEDKPVWGDEFTQGHARVEIRGGSKTIKKITSTQAVADNGITWEEQLTLEVLPGASELRIMLCRPKGAERSSTSIVAACGIYMKDLLDAGPVDKYFELFKPGGGKAGGFIRVAISFLEPDQVRNGTLESEEEQQPARHAHSPVEEQPKQEDRRGVGRALVKLGLLAAGAAAVVVVAGKVRNKEGAVVTLRKK
ncbi:hypothetical protein D9Q98_007542 [Chlorella vulgaris]|uniref:C2 domain-containing protein n=1 Tax=Chlorella vulgaris TaxID=3077 RepID=A0A9D4TLK6_CHLVU|nr:hypothetical protein D9Q98_007542 [Chlorella vulgaris]